MKITKRKSDGRFRGTIKMPNGKYKHVYGRNKTDVKNRIKEIEASIIKEEYTELNNITFKALAEEWIKNYCLNVKDSTLEKYTQYLSNWLLPTFGDRKVQEILHRDIQSFIREIKDKLSPKTVANIYSVLNQILHTAVINGIITKNPADNTTLPKIRQKEIEPLSEDELKAFFNLIHDTRYADIFLFLLLTGLRTMEALGITEDRVNIKDSTIIIDRQLIESDPISFDVTKSGLSRKIYLNDFTKPIVENRIALNTAYRKIAPGINPEHLIFYGYFERITRRSLYYECKKYGKMIGRENLRIHDFRHTFTTLALGEGVDLKTVQKALGHSTPSITLGIYSHSTEQNQRKAAKMMERIGQNIGQNWSN